MPDVFVLGSFVADAAYRASRLPVWGETLLGSSFVLGPGGKGSNQAVAASRAGADVAFLTKIGEDAFGELGRNLWADERIDTSGVLRASTPTGSAAILLDEGTGSNAIIVVPGACGTLTAAEVECFRAAIAASRVFLAQLEVPLTAVTRGFELAHAAGITTILNPAPAQTLPPELLALVDFLIPNETEAAHLTGFSADAETTVQKLLALGVRNVVLTLGAGGSLLSTADRDTKAISPVPCGEVADTTGAGDSFCGAFGAALAEGKPALEACRFAFTAAGIAVTRHGTASVMPNRAEILAALA